MADEHTTYPLVEALVRRSRIPRLWFVIIITAALLIFLTLTTILDDSPADLGKLSFWRLNIDEILLIAYIPIIYPFMMRLRERAIQAFKPLISLDEVSFERLATDIIKPIRRWELVAILVGIAFTIGIGQPWTLGWGSGESWLSTYMVISSVILWGMLGWLIYDTFFGIVRIARLSGRDLKLDILDTEMLVPIARWSLGISLVFIGGFQIILLKPSAIKTVFSMMVLQ